MKHPHEEKLVSRREFGKRVAGAAFAPVALGGLGNELAVSDVNRLSMPAQETTKQEKASVSRAEELMKKAEAQLAQRASTLRAKSLPYDLEPAFVFSARPRERKTQGSKEVRK